MAIGERQPERRSNKAEATIKVEVERQGNARIWFFPFVMISELNSHSSTWTAASRYC
jgi:hypothetical protein